MDYNSLPNFYAALDAKYNVTNNELNSATYTNVDCNFVYSAKYARHRWFNYKEGFSPILVEKIFNEYKLNKSSVVCDPFCGAGTTVAVAKAKGMKSNDKILDTEVTWSAFCRAINKEILDGNVRMTSSEDKRLGAYFVSKLDLWYDPVADDVDASEQARIVAKHHNRRFPEKVIKYLWDDAFKFSRENIFEISSYKSLEAVIKKFTSETGNERFAFFKEGMFNAITGQNNGED